MAEIHASPLCATPEVGGPANTNPEQWPAPLPAAVRQGRSSFDGSRPGPPPLLYVSINAKGHKTHAADDQGRTLCGRIGSVEGELEDGHLVDPAFCHQCLEALVPTVCPRCGGGPLRLVPACAAPLPVFSCLTCGHQVYPLHDIEVLPPPGRGPLSKGQANNPRNSAQGYVRL